MRRLMRYLAAIRIFLYNKFNNRVNIGIGTNWQRNFTLQCLTGEVKIGKKCFFNNGCSINCKGKIVIGDYCIFGENVKFYDHNHIYSDANQPVARQGFKTGHITVGNNCWIGANVTILKDVEIGDNCVIGANCLIYKSIAANSIVTLNQSLSVRKRDSR